MPAESASNRQLHRFVIIIVGVVGFISSILGIIEFIRTRADSVTPQYNSIHMLLWAGFATACLHGVCWRFIDSYFGWEFWGGGRGALPKGWQAISLSFSMTLPILIGPPLFAYIFGGIVLPPFHYAGATLAIIMAALGHFLLYGTKQDGFIGLKFRIFPLDGQALLGRAVKMEFVYAAVHFSSILLAYRIVAYGISIPTAIDAFLISAAAGMLWAVFVSSLIFLMYPKTLTENRIVEVRGTLNATVLMMVLVAGMLW